MTKKIIYIIISIFFTGCIDRQNINIEIDEYYTVNVISSDSMKTKLNSFSDKTIYNGLSRYTTFDGIYTSYDDKTYFKDINSSQDYYLEVNYYTNKPLTTENKDKNYFMVEYPLTSCSDNFNIAKEYLHVETERISNQRYHYSVYFSIPLEQGVNLYPELNISEKNKKVFLPNPVEDLCLKIVDYYEEAFVRMYT